MPGVSISTAVNVHVPREELFYWLVAVDLASIMHGYGILPGVASTRGQTGPMHQVGASREIVFLDGTSAVEEITHSDPPRSLHYRVHSITSPFRVFVRDTEASFAYKQLSPGETAIEWRYTFHGHSRIAEFVLRPLVALFWRGFMRGTLARAKRQAEAQWDSSSSGVAA